MAGDSQPWGCIDGKHFGREVVGHRSRVAKVGACAMPVELHMFHCTCLGYHVVSPTHLLGIPYINQSYWVRDPDFQISKLIAYRVRSV